MKKLVLIFLLFVHFTAVAGKPDSMPQSVFDDIIGEVITESGHYDSIAVEQAITQWLLEQPLPLADGNLVDSGACSPCEASDVGINPDLPQPRNIKFKGKKNQNDSLPETYSIYWKEPNSLPNGSNYELSHYRVHIIKNNEDYEIYEVLPKTKRNGKTVKNNQLKFHNHAEGNYQVQVQAVYSETTTATSSATKAGSTKTYEYSSSDWTDGSLYTVTKQNKTVANLTGALKTCINNAGYSDSESLTTFIKVDCRNSNLQNSDVAQLVDFINIRSIALNDNTSITDISDLKQLSYLTLLSLDGNSSITLDFGSSVFEQFGPTFDLTTLYLSNMNLTSVPDLSGQLNLDYLDFSDNPIDSGYENIPYELVVLDVAKTGAVLDPTGEPETCDPDSTIETLNISANQYSSRYCPQIEGLKYLSIENGLFANPNVDVFGFASENGGEGLCGLNIEETDIIQLNGRPPIQFLFLENNPKLQKVQPYFFSINGQIKLNHGLSISEDDSKLWCTNRYFMESFTSTYSAVEGSEIPVGCPLLEAPNIYDIPNYCKPDPLAAVHVYEDEATNRRYVVWSKNNDDDDLWGVDRYQIKSFKESGKTIQYVPVDYPQPHVIESLQETKFVVKGCTPQKCGYDAIVEEVDFQQGITNVFDVDVVWDTSSTPYSFKFRFSYPDYAFNAPGETGKPDYFLISPDFIQPEGYPTEERLDVSSSTNQVWENLPIKKDKYIGSNFTIKACKELDITGVGIVPMCSPGTSVVLGNPLTSYDIPNIGWLNANLQGHTGILLSWDNSLLDEVDIDHEYLVDYLEVIEDQPFRNHSYDFNDGNPQLVESIYYIGRKEDGTFHNSELLNRITRGNYSFKVRACHRDRVSGDVCAPIYTELNSSIIYLPRNEITQAPPAPSNLGVATYDVDGNTNYALVWDESISPQKDADYYAINYEQIVLVIPPGPAAPAPPEGCTSGLVSSIIENAETNKFDVNTTNGTVEKISNVQSCSNLGVVLEGGGGGVYEHKWSVKACYYGLGCGEETVFSITPDNPVNPIGTLLGFTPPNTPNTLDSVGGPGDMSPGVWWNPALSGTGWHFYWASELRYPSVHENYGNTYDLVGVWLTYKLQNEEWTPIWIISNLKLKDDCNPSNGSSCYFEGAMQYVTRESDTNTPETIGRLQVLFSTNGNNEFAKLNMKIDADLGFSTNSVPLEANGCNSYEVGEEGDPNHNYYNICITDGNNGSINMPLLNFGQSMLNGQVYGEFGNDIDHYSGMWSDQSGEFGYLVDINKNLEWSALAFYDTDGDPIWALSDSCEAGSCTPTTDGDYASDYLIVRTGFNPLHYTPNDFWSQENNVVTLNDVGGTNRGDSRRKFKETNILPDNPINFREAKFFADINIESNFLPGRYVGANLSKGTANSPVIIKKLTSLHDIRFFINDHDESESTCDPNTEANGECVISFTWFTDDDFPSIEPYYSVDLGSGFTDYEKLSKICPTVPLRNYVVERYECTFTAPGTYRFQLHKNDYVGDGTEVIAESIELGSSNLRELTVMPCLESGICYAIADVSPQMDADVIEIETQVANQPGAGPIPGNGGVSGGSSTYNLPLSIPPGRNGMTPSISVNYSSKGGNGILGVGWSLSAGSSIYRCPQTLAQDGENHAVTNNITDRLCLDGQRLMLYSGDDYWSANAVYRTEQDSFVKVSWDSNNNIIVQTKSGRTNTYAQQGTNDLNWYLVMEEDSFSNNIIYNYSERGENEWLLEEITYTGFAQQPGNRSIKFTYQDRLDKNISYLAGQRSDTTGRLEKIETFTPGSINAARTYTFSYNYSIATGRTQLDSVKEEAGNTPRTLLTNTWSQDDVSSGWNANGTPDTALERIGLDTIGLQTYDYDLEYYKRYSAFKLGLTNLQPIGDLNGDGIKELFTKYREICYQVDANGDPIVDGDGNPIPYEPGDENVPDDCYFYGDEPVLPYRASYKSISFDKDLKPNFIIDGFQNSEWTYDFDLDGRMDKAIFINTGTLENPENHLYITRWLSSTELPPTHCDENDQIQSLDCKVEVLDLGITINSNLYGSEFYDIDNDGDLDFIYLDTGIEVDCVDNPLGEVAEGVKCYNLKVYYNNPDLQNAVLLNQPADVLTQTVNVYFSGFTMGADGIQPDQDGIPLYIQYFVGMEDLNGDGIAEIKLKNVHTTSRMMPPTISYLSKLPEPDGRYKLLTPEDLGLIKRGSDDVYQYFQWLDINNDGLNDYLYLENINNEYKWAAKINTGSQIFSADGTFNNALFSTIEHSDNGDYLNGPDLESGYPSDVGCNYCTRTPQRANSIRKFDINSDGKSELIIANPGNMMWNSCRVFEGINCDIQQCEAPPVGSYSYMTPVGKSKAASHIENPGDNSPLEGGNDIFILCADDQAMLPEFLATTSASVDGSLYSNQTGTRPYNYKGNLDESIYKYDALEFSVGFTSSGAPKLLVNKIPTDLVASINGGQSTDVDNDGIEDFYSSFGCEWQGCISSGSSITLGGMPSNSAYDSDLDTDSVFYPYIQSFCDNGVCQDQNEIDDAKNAFRTSIKLQSSYAVNKVNAVMPDMLVKVKKPNENSYVEWDYATLSTPRSYRSEFPVYSIPDRETGDSYVDQPGVARDHFYFNSSMYVVSEMRSSNGLVNESGDTLFSTNQYSYQEAVYNNKGRGFQGFRKISIKSIPIDGSDEFSSLSESTFHQVFPYAGKLEEINVWQPASDYDFDLLSQHEDYTYASACVDSTTGISFCPMIEKTNKTYDKDEYGSNDISTQSGINNITYDPYGNIETQTSFIETLDVNTNSSVRIETTTIENDYYNANTNDWWIDKLNTTKVTKSVNDTRSYNSSVTTGSHITTSKFIWQEDGTNRRKLDCQITSLGSASIVDNCSYESDSVNASRNKFIYDSFGNITQIDTQGYNGEAYESRTVETTYTTDSYFPASITKYRHQFDTTGLETSFTYDNATGQVRTNTAINGTIIKNTYDTFGFKTLTEQFDIDGLKFGQDMRTAMSNCPALDPNGLDLCAMAQSIVDKARSQMSLNANINNQLTFFDTDKPVISYVSEQVQNGQPRVTSWYDASGNVILTETQHSDSQTYYVMNLINPLGITEISTKAFDYNGNFIINNDTASVITRSYPFVTILKTDDKGRVTYKLSEVGDLAATTLAGRSSGDCRLETTYTHNGGKTDIYAGYVDCSSTVPNNLHMSRVYDATGKLLSTTDADDSQPTPNTIKYWYDASGNPLVLQDAKGNEIITEFDALGRKLSVDDPNMGTKGFSYNSFGEVIKQWDSLEYYNFYKYDHIGRLTEQLSNVNWNGDPKNNGALAYKDTFLYDHPNALGQMEVSNRETNRYTALEGEVGYGLVFSGVNEYSKMLDYDSKSRVITEETVIYDALTTGAQVQVNEGEIFTTGYHYDDNHNRVKQVNYQGGFAIRNYYTTFGSLLKQKDGRIEQANQDNSTNINDTLLYVNSWNFQGAETKRTFNDNGAMFSTTAYYPSTGQVAEIVNGSAGDAESLSYKYDPWGNITSQAMQRGGGAYSASESFAYDRLHRLTNAHVAGDEAKVYSYDRLGNITSKSDFSIDDYVYGDVQNPVHNTCSNGWNSRPNAVSSVLTSQGTIQYHYDHRGNRIYDCLNNNWLAYYSYDANNLMVYSNSSVTAPGIEHKLYFSYGTDNQRYKKYDVNNSEITLYANKDYEKIFDLNTAEVQDKYYLTSYLTITKSNTTGKKVNFMQKDRLGSTTQILDEAGNVLHNKSYDAFGKPRNGDDWSDYPLFQSKLEFDTPLLDAAGNIQYDNNGDIIFDETAIDLSKRGFTDHEHLDEMQLIHMNGRMYDYNNGRFLSVDPFIQDPGSTQSLNPYTYIFNNPLSGVDPSGYATCKESAKVSCLDDGENEIVDDDGNVIRKVFVESKNGKGKGGKGALKAFLNENRIADLKSQRRNVNPLTDEYMDIIIELSQREYAKKMYDRCVSISRSGSCGDSELSDADKILYANAKVIVHIVGLSAGSGSLTSVTKETVTSANKSIILSRASKQSSKKWTSDDNFVAETANAIEAKYPGLVVDVERVVYWANGKRATDYDILLKNAVIQIKTAGKGMAKQLRVSEEISGLPAYGYGPKLKHSIIKNTNSTRDLDTLLEWINPNK